MMLDHTRIESHLDPMPLKLTRNNSVDLQCVNYCNITVNKGVFQQPLHSCGIAPGQICLKRSCKQLEQMDKPLLELTELSQIISCLHTYSTRFNSSPPSATCMRQWTESAVVQVMTCAISLTVTWPIDKTVLVFGAKPLPEPMLTYCPL